MERKDVFGITFEQRRNDRLIDDSLYQTLSHPAGRPTAQNGSDNRPYHPKYTQSTSVCYAKDGQAIGIERAAVENPLHKVCGGQSRQLVSASASESSDFPLEGPHMKRTTPRIFT